MLIVELQRRFCRRGRLRWLRTIRCVRGARRARRGIGRSPLQIGCHGSNLRRNCGRHLSRRTAETWQHNLSNRFLRLLRRVGGGLGDETDGSVQRLLAGGLDVIKVLLVVARGCVCLLCRGCRHTLRPPRHFSELGRQLALFLQG